MISVIFVCVCASMFFSDIVIAFGFIFCGLHLNWCNRYRIWIHQFCCSLIEHPEDDNLLPFSLSEIFIIIPIYEFETATFIVLGFYDSSFLQLLSWIFWPWYMIIWWSLGASKVSIHSMEKPPSMALIYCLLFIQSL